MQIRITCQTYNNDKVYGSSILPSSRNFSDIGQINEAIRKLCHKTNLFFLISKT